jgi:hypothetical protein
LVVVKGIWVESGFEVNFDRVDERDEPGKEFEMDRMHVVGFHRGTVDNFMTPANSYPWERGEKLTPTFVSRMPGIWVWRPRILSWARCF